MDWISRAQSLFKTKKPEHFTHYHHCEECEEHDFTLKQFDLDTITLRELGNPSWDPITFCLPQGKLYYVPALIRITLESIERDFYFEQLLFHLNSTCEKTSLWSVCNEPQRKFFCEFIAFMIDGFSQKLDDSYCASEALAAYEIWSEPKSLVS